MLTPHKYGEHPYPSGRSESLEGAPYEDGELKMGQGVPPKRQTPPHDKGGRPGHINAHSHRYRRSTPSVVSDQPKGRKEERLPYLILWGQANMKDGSCHKRHRHALKGQVDQPLVQTGQATKLKGYLHSN